MPADPLAYLFSLEHFGIKFGLDNIHAIVEALGHPERTFASVHVGGTNGKGSVTAMVEAGARAAGLKTGRYTSPHLVHLTERFAVNGQAVNEETLRTVVGDVRDAVSALQSQGRLDVQPTFFEVTTATAFEIFRRAGVQIAICEVGLGGRLDATNVLSPVVSAITSIGLDHQQYLGQTIAEIATEKAGIIKTDVPVVIGDMDDVASGVMIRTARERQAPLVRASAGVRIQPQPAGRFGAARFDLATPSRDYGRIELALAGGHQIGNAIVAVRVLETLDGRGLPISIESVRQGLATVQWPGRLEHLEVGDGRSLLLDAAHNTAGAEALALFLRDHAPRPMVFAAMKDKDASGILRALSSAISVLVLTRASHPRAADPQALADLAAALMPGVPRIVEPSPRAALDAAWRHGPDVVVAGSIFLLGDVLKELAAS